MCQRYTILLFRSLVASLFLLGAGCSGEKPVYPVAGKVLFEGRPAVGAVVKFYSAEAADPKFLAPQAVVGDDGTFRLTTYKAEDGAPAGKYAVSVFWAKPSKSGDDYDKLLIPARYLNAATSGLTAVVEEKATELRPFQLAGGPSAISEHHDLERRRGRDSR
jgi:hypothetical protein